MNQQNLEVLFRNYIDHSGYFEDPKGGFESYKWIAVEQVQKAWDLAAPDLSGMIKEAFSKTYNLINNRIVSPGNGLVLLAKEEPEAVRKALDGLLTETEDADQKQENILRFVDEINGLLEKHFPGKWKYTQDVRVAITYLALIIPSQNYLFKSTPAHRFARYMDFGADIGYGRDFKLKYYYQMCDELLEIVKQQPELLEKDATRKVSWKDESHHLLVTDLIYCFGVYKFMNAGMFEPVPRKRSKSSADLEAREKKAAELQARLEALQDEMDAIEKEIQDLPTYSFEGKKVKTKLYGEVAIEKQNGNYLSFTAEGKKREYALPGCVSNGFLIPEEEEIRDRYRKESELQEKLQKLSSQQRQANIELGQC